MIKFQRLLIQSAVLLLGNTYVDAQSPSSFPLLQQTDLVYQGAFRVPEGPSDQMSFSYGGTALGYNQAHNSLFMVGHSWFQVTAEVGIPELVNSSTIDDLAFATLLQNFEDVTEGMLAAINPGDPNGKFVGGNLVYNGNLYTTGYTYYDAEASQVLSHFKSSVTLSQTGDVQGPFQVGTLGAGFVSGYMTTVPLEWRDSLGGPALTGNCCLPIITRTSFGPAACVFDPNDLGVENPVPVTPLVYYPASNPTLANWDATNPVFNGTTQIPGVVFPDSTRSVLFIGRHGVGTFCYGEANVCNDPADGAKGTHAYPYVYQIWAYDAVDLVAAAKGRKNPWDITPYAVWTFHLPFEDTGDMHAIGGATYDPNTRQIYISQGGKDPGAYGSFSGPVIHAFKVNIPRSRVENMPVTMETMRLSVYPNPFNPATSISFSVKGQHVVEVSVFTTEGRLIRTLTSGTMSGTNQIVWDGKDSRGIECNSGMYLVKLKSGSKVLVRKALFAK